MAVVMDPQMPTGTEVASYETYAQARAGVDFLSDAGFDVSAITIVGSDLLLVERVKGRLTIARASLSGASSGGLWGALCGMLMSAGQNAGGTGAWVAGGIIVGALIGMALSALSFIIRGRSRDLVSSQQVVAQRYAVLASADIDLAYQLLQRTPATARASRARAPSRHARRRIPSVSSPMAVPVLVRRPRTGRCPADARRPRPRLLRPRAHERARGRSPRAEHPESAPTAHEEAPASSPEKDQTEA